MFVAHQPGWTLGGQNRSRTAWLSYRVSDMAKRIEDSNLRGPTKCTAKQPMSMNFCVPRHLSPGSSHRRSSSTASTTSTTARRRSLSSSSTLSYIPGRRRSETASLSAHNELSPPQSTIARQRLMMSSSPSDIYHQEDFEFGGRRVLVLHRTRHIDDGT